MISARKKCVDIVIETHKESKCVAELFTSVVDVGMLDLPALESPKHVNHPCFFLLAGLLKCYDYWNSSCGVVPYSYRVN